MKLLQQALSVSAVCLCGAMITAGPGVFGRIRLFWNTPAPASAVEHPVPPPFRLEQVIRVLARKHGVQQTFVKSIIAAESGFKQDAVSNRGAIGLMQLMPDTAHDMGVDPTIAEQNVEGGTKYLGWLLRRYSRNRNGFERAIAAYNAGPGNVDRYQGIPHFPKRRTM